MLYALHETTYRSLAPLNWSAQAARAFWSSPLNPMGASLLGRTLYAAADMTANLTQRYDRPAWRIDGVTVGETTVPVKNAVVWSSPWMALRRFSRDPAALLAAGGDPDVEPVLIVAPLSGHYATLLRGTVQAFLGYRDVYITDWSNAREVPVWAGRFDLNDYIDTVMAALRHLGARTHVVAVCQPGPAVMVASALMSEDGEDCRPASVTLMGSPIDARFAPTVTNKLAEERPFTWFESNMIYTVPAPYPGMMRRVYPGFVQLFSFMSMNLEAHQSAHRRYFGHLVAGDGDSSEKHREFYDEYLSVLDLTEEFYLQTVDHVFQRHLLPKGEFVHRDRRVDLSAITDIPLMTVEGENDDISGIGQTQAAHALCPNAPKHLSQDWVQPGVGHYGVFNGRRFEAEILPRANAFQQQAQTALS